MPLYEIVLRFPSHEEIRLTDHDPGLQGEVRVDGRSWLVVAEEEGGMQESVAKRYVAQPAG
jgi:hypothetical protein